MTRGLWAFQVDRGRIEQPLENAGETIKTPASGAESGALPVDPAGLAYLRSRWPEATDADLAAVLTILNRSR